MKALLCLALCLLHGIANAARPMVTDDARTVDPGACQMESWLKFNRHGQEAWALPACNFTGNLELTLGGGLERAPGSGTASDVVVQGKTIFKPLQTNGYGVGLVVGSVRHPSINPANNGLGDVYAYTPASFSLRDDKMIVHTNLGLLRGQSERRNHLTWGLGSESQLSTSTWLIAESYGQNSGKTWFQLGLRHWLIADRVQIDTTYGNRFSKGDEPWISVGLRLLTPSLLQ